MSELIDTISPDELMEWMAYDRLDPFGGYRSDLQTAQLVMAQLGDKDSKLHDFVLFDPNPLPDDIKERQQQEQEKQELETMTQRLMLEFEGL